MHSVGSLVGEKMLDVGHVMFEVFGLTTLYDRLNCGVETGN